MCNQDRVLFAHVVPNHASPRRRHFSMKCPARRKPGRTVFIIIVLLALAVAGSHSAVAQSLNWEGQTGVFVTPLAYSVPTGNAPLSIPVVSYHYLNAGPVLGGFHQISITMGAFNRVEFGYTGSIHQDGDTTGLSPLWSREFNTFHAKVNLLRERRGGLPALSVGFVARTQVRNVGGVIAGQDTHNQDFYVVATKTITRIRKLPLVFNAGFKATNASLLGLAGNAPGYYGRAFGAGGFAFKGPGRSTILLGSEVMQEPRSIQGLPGAAYAHHNHLRGAYCALGSFTDSRLGCRDTQADPRLWAGPGGGQYHAGCRSRSAASVRIRHFIRILGD